MSYLIQDLEEKLKIEAELAERNRLEIERLTKVRADIDAQNEEINYEKIISSTQQNDYGYKRCIQYIRIYYVSYQLLERLRF